MPADLAAHEGLGYSLARMPNRWRMREPRGRWVEVSMKSTLRSNNDFVLRKAAIDGLGLAMFPDFFVEDELADGRLVPVLAECRTEQLTVSAVYASRRNVPPKLCVFVDFLAERFGEAAIAVCAGTRRATGSCVTHGGPRRSLSSPPVHHCAGGAPWRKGRCSKVSAAPTNSSPAAASRLTPMLPKRSPTRPAP